MQRRRRAAAPSVQLRCRLPPRWRPAGAKGGGRALCFGDAGFSAGGIQRRHVRAACARAAGGRRGAVSRRCPNTAGIETPRNVGSKSRCPVAPAPETRNRTYYSGPGSRVQGPRRGGGSRRSCRDGGFGAAAPFSLGVGRAAVARSAGPGPETVDQGRAPKTLFATDAAQGPFRAGSCRPPAFCLCHQGLFRGRRHSPWPDVSRRGRPPVTATQWHSQRPHSPRPSLAGANVTCRGPGSEPRHYSPRP